MSREMKNSGILSKTPGPGTYEQLDQKVKHTDPSWSLSKTPKLEMSKSAVVGPGAYELDEKYNKLVKSSNGYSLGRDEKLKYDLGKVPGPG